MLVRIIAVGKLKKGFARDGVYEYARRIRHYCQLEVVEVSEERLPPVSGSRSDGERARILSGEGARIRPHLESLRACYGLDPGGRLMDSVEFARNLERALPGGRLGFVVGGPNGLDDDLKRTMTDLVSFSPMTFPHDLFRVVLHEQIYRAFSILRGHPYHR